MGEGEAPPIIILQGDHGSKVYDEIDPPDAVKIKLLFPILNAYRLPGVEDSQLYSTITPVNSFRVIFNQYFGTDLLLLEDANYILDSDQNEYVHICEMYTGCSLP